MSQDIINWRLPRPHYKNQQFKLKGIMISGVLTNRVLGEALAQDKNLLLTSNFNHDHLGYEPLIQIDEICYKNDLYHLEWDIDWLINSHPGNKIIAKIIQADHQLISSHASLPVITYGYHNKLMIMNSIHRLDHTIFYGKQRQQNGKITKVILVLHWSQQVLDFLIDNPSNNVLILTTELIPKYLDILVKYDYFIIWSHPQYILNEVCRELYYLLKRGQSIDIDYSINKTVTARVRINNGLDGI